MLSVRIQKKKKKRKERTFRGDGYGCGVVYGDGLMCVYLSSKSLGYIHWLCTAFFCISIIHQKKKNQDTWYYSGVKWRKRNKGVVVSFSLLSSSHPPLMTSLTPGQLQGEKYSCEITSLRATFFSSSRIL